MKKTYAILSLIAISVLVAMFYPTQQRVLDAKIKEYEERIQTLSWKIEKTRVDRVEAEKQWKEKDQTMSWQINDMKKDLDKVQKCIDVKTLDCDGVETKKLVSFLSSAYAEWTVATASSVVPERTLRSVLSIAECDSRELNFNTKHKLPKYNLEWLAYDIPPCIKWESIEVHVPMYWEDWIIEKVWFWNNLWNFMILKEVSSDLRIVFWHTETRLKEWGRVKKWWIIGKTNISWASTWMHLHVELWKWENIVSKHVFWSSEFTSTPEWQLAQHRSWKFTDESKNSIVDFVKKYECPHGPILKAYFDYSGFSIGCWTPSKEWEVITEKEALDRLDMWMQSVQVVVKKDFPWISQNQIIALSSLSMNNGKCYNHFRDNWVDETIWREKCNLAWGERLKWLTTRRNDEADLYFWKK